MCISFMHDFHSKTSSVKNVSPSIHHTTLTFNNGLIEVEPIEVERHGGDAEGGKPDSHDRLGGEEEVERTAVIEGSILENKASEIAMSSNDVVRFFFLTELVTIVLGLSFSGFTNQ